MNVRRARGARRARRVGQRVVAEDRDRPRRNEAVVFAVVLPELHRVDDLPDRPHGAAGGVHRLLPVDLPRVGRAARGVLDRARPVDDEDHVVERVQGAALLPERDDVQADGDRVAVGRERGDEVGGRGDLHFDTIEALISSTMSASTARHSGRCADDWPNWRHDVARAMYAVRMDT